MKQYNVTLFGETALLMHNDNLAWADVMDKWRLDPANKAISKAGDDRTPAWRWIGNLYVHGGNIVMPADNLMTVLREGGKKVPTGKGQQTFKSQTQSGIIIDQVAWPLLVEGGALVPYKPLKKLIGEPNFERHVETANQLGFDLFVKRAKIGSAKHVRVRPRFDTWALRGSLTVLDDAITPDVLASIMKISGVYCGLCDWRPSSPRSPGPYGKFTVEIEEV